MISHEFTIVAGGPSVEDDEWTDRFYEAGCDDALLMVQRGLFVLDFNREAETFEDALASACENVRSAGAQIVRIEPDPLVSASDMAERAGLTRQAVSLYVNGERGEDFPTPVACVSGSRALWKWSDVAAWLNRAGKLDDAAVANALLIERLNAQGFEEPNPEICKEVGIEVVVESIYTKAEFYHAENRREIEAPKFRSERTRIMPRKKIFELRPKQPSPLQQARA